MEGLAFRQSQYENGHVFQSLCARIHMPNKPFGSNNRNTMINSP